MAKKNNGRVACTPWNVQKPEEVDRRLEKFGRKLETIYARALNSLRGELGVPIPNS